MFTFSEFDQFDLASLAFRLEGGTIYRGKEEHSGRYIVGGLATVTVPHTLPRNEFAKACLNTVFDMALDGNSMLAETLGVWHSNGRAYFDLGDTWTSLTAALVTAKTRGELAIWDRVTQSEVLVEA